jgi:hypothetical protein
LQIAVFVEQFDSVIVRDDDVSFHDVGDDDDELFLHRQFKFCFAAHIASKQSFQFGRMNLRTARAVDTSGAAFPFANLAMTNMLHVASFSAFARHSR